MEDSPYPPKHDFLSWFFSLLSLNFFFVVLFRFALGSSSKSHETYRLCRQYKDIVVTIYNLATMLNFSGSNLGQIYQFFGGYSLAQRVGLVLESIFMILYVYYNHSEAISKRVIFYMILMSSLPFFISSKYRMFNPFMYSFINYAIEDLLGMWKKDTIWKTLQLVFWLISDMLEYPITIHYHSSANHLSKQSFSYQVFKPVLWMLSMCLWVSDVIDVVEYLFPTTMKLINVLVKKHYLFCLLLVPLWVSSMIQTNHIFNCVNVNSQIFFWNVAPGMPTHLFCVLMFWIIFLSNCFLFMLGAKLYSVASANMRYSTYLILYQTYNYIYKYGLYWDMRFSGAIENEDVVPDHYFHFY